MNEVLKILDSNNLYRHIILFKLYVESNGDTNYQLESNLLRNSIKEIFGENFNYTSYSLAKSYLINKNYTNQSGTTLTYDGLYYFEDWIKSFENLTQSEIEKLNKELPKPIFDFFKFTSRVTTVLSFITQILKLSEKL